MTNESKAETKRLLATKTLTPTEDQSVKKIEVKRYVLTIYVAAPGTPLMTDGKIVGKSLPGHLFYSINELGKTPLSAGFAPIKEGDPRGPGEPKYGDLGHYVNLYYERSMEISKWHYDRLLEFRQAPQKFGFDLEYAVPENNCVDFVWAALNHAKVYKQVPTMIPTDTVLQQGTARTRPVYAYKFTDYEGNLRPSDNMYSIKQIPAPYPNSDLNKEILRQKPPVPIWQKLLGENQSSPAKPHYG